MGRAPDMSDFDRGLIVGARLAGASVSRTAEITHYSRGTVSKVMTAWKTTGKTSSAKHSSGRRRLLCEWDRRVLIRIVARNSMTTAARVCAEFNQGRQHPVSVKTVRRELHSAGYYGRADVPKPLL